MSQSTLLVVIPTRNRHDLATNAIQSVLSQGADRVQVLVSDNSTDATSRQHLTEYCLRLDDPRLVYTAPPSPFPMTEHWDWVMQYAVQEYPHVTHFTYLTDRMILKPGELEILQRAVSSYGDEVISYQHDQVADHEAPFRVMQSPWSGKLIEISSDRLLALSAQGQLYGCLPRMLNCIVPRVIVEALKDRHGTVFSSIAPDFNFCFRLLGMVPSIVFFDRAPLVHYAQARSNGKSLARNVMTKDYRDFVVQTGGGQLKFDATPLPEVMTGGNAMLHEYCHARAEAGGGRFPPLDKKRYLQLLASEMGTIEDPERRASAWSQIQEYARACDLTDAITAEPLFKKLTPRRVREKIVWERSGERAKGLWMLLHRWLGVYPPDDNRFGFDTVEEAREFAKRFPRRPLTSGSSHPTCEGRDLGKEFAEPYA